MRFRLKSDRALGGLVPLFLVLLVAGVGLARAQDGRGHIMAGIGNYDDGDFEGAIRYFQAALRDLSLDYKDSTFVFFSLAACNGKLERAGARDDYFRMILTRNIDAKLRDDLEEFSPEFESLRVLVGGEYSRRLFVNSTPDSATVYIDGLVKGQTPLTIEALQSNRTYRVTVKKTGYDSTAQFLRMEGDTTLVLALQKATSRTPQPPVSVQTRVIYTGPGVRSYAVGLSMGAGLGLASYFTSVMCDNTARDKLKAHTIADDPDDAAALRSAVSTYQTLGNVLYYASYPLMAVGFYAGMKLSERIFPEYAYLMDENSPTRVYCSLDENLNLSLGVRRSIW